MHDSVAYRTNATACAKLAMEVSDPHNRLLLLSMAEGWIKLADYVDRRERDERAQRLGTDIPSRDGNVKRSRDE
jgi:hypothetical protein